MVAFDFVTGALIFILSLAAAPCTRRYRFMATFRCVFIFKTRFGAHWSFKIFVLLAFLRSSFFFKVSRSGEEEMILVVIQVDFFTSRRLYSFLSSLLYSLISGML